MLASGDEPPSPLKVGTFDELTGRLRQLRAWAGNPSYAELARRIAVARTARRPPPIQCRPARGTVYSCFQPGRRRLDVELVIDIVRALGADEALALQWRQACRVAGGQASVESTVSVRAGLAPAGPVFVGRHAELHRLNSLSATTARASVIVSIEGMAGVGKSQLAIQAGQRLIRAGRFRQQLMVNLRGYDPDQLPADPAAVLGGFLRLLGLPGPDVEQLDLPARIRAYRSMLADRPALVVLDNAVSDDQIRPLLPIRPGCFVLITSRRTLAVGRRLALAAFEPADSIELLTRLIGRARVAAEPAAARQLAQLCGQLPLELFVGGSRIHRTPGWTLADHVARLEASPRDDAVRPALATSYDSLPAALQQLFRLLALHPGRTISAAAAAALADLDLATAGQLLDELRAEHLLQRNEIGHYEFHDLIRSHASRLVSDQDPQSRQLAAVRRLLEYYRRTAQAAVRLLSPEAGTDPAGGIKELVSAEAAADWLEAESANLIAAGVYASKHGMAELTAALAASLGNYLDRTARWREAQLLHTCALASADPAAQCRALIGLAVVDQRMGRFHEALGRFRTALVMAGELGDRATTARVLNSLGAASERLGRHQQAVSYHLDALAICLDLDDRDGQARAHGNLGVSYDSLGRLADALRHYQQAMEIFEQAGDRLEQGRLLANIGILCERQGRYAEAAASQLRAVAIARVVHDAYCEAAASSNLAVVHARQGNFGEAMTQAELAGRICEEIGDLPGQAHTSYDLGRVLRLAGRSRPAITRLRKALALADSVGEASLQVLVHAELGDALRENGQHHKAESHYRTALSLAAGRSDSYGLARAREGLAHLSAAAGEHATAREYRQSALAGYTALGVAEAGPLRLLLGG